MAPKKRKKTEKEKDVKSNVKETEKTKQPETVPSSAAAAAAASDVSERKSCLCNVGLLKRKLGAAHRIIALLRARASDRHDEYKETGMAIKDRGFCYVCYADQFDCDCLCANDPCENQAKYQCRTCSGRICDTCKDENDACKKCLPDDD